MSGLEKRLERIEAQLAIQQLPARYAVAVDSRNLDDLVGLFAADVNCGRWGTGREALKRYYASPGILGSFYRSVHLICGQTLDLIDAEHASGTVYCRAGHEDKGQWIEMAICYFDHYVKRIAFPKSIVDQDYEVRPIAPVFGPEAIRYLETKIVVLHIRLDLRMRFGHSAKFCLPIAIEDYPIEMATPLVRFPALSA